ncbi:MAG TPA: acetyltransferase [Burkholderiales bacterium]|nr:acetyltransferase [Burkholderiales bacterium]
MRFYDIFNGDADGICALLQLRLDEPHDSTLITGVKRDIDLLARVEAARDDDLTVLDVSMHSNAQALRRALDAGARVRYFDHHFAGEIPSASNLEAHIDTAPDTCTSLIVDRHLGGRQRAWAVVAAFGDNLAAAATAAAAPLGVNAAQLATLRELGELINYNAYGDSVADLHFDPAELYRTLAQCRDPLQFVERGPAFDRLRLGYRQDMDAALGLHAEAQTPAAAVFVLPDTAWARRVSGSFANHLASSHPERAHAVLMRKADTFQVSVRAPQSRPSGADALCRAFESGGGRAGAAGINRLAQADYPRFVAAFERQFAAP